MKRQQNRKQTQPTKPRPPKLKHVVMNRFGLEAWEYRALKKLFPGSVFDQLLKERNGLDEVIAAIRARKPFVLPVSMVMLCDPTKRKKGPRKVTVGRPQVFSANETKSA